MAAEAGISSTTLSQRKGDTGRMLMVLPMTHRTIDREIRHDREAAAAEDKKASAQVARRTGSSWRPILSMRMMSVGEPPGARHV